MWPPEAIEFLTELEANNDRDWFKANRALYDDHLVAPARELAGRLAHLGQVHLFRPYNDTRFHMRPPIKEQIGVAIGYGGAGGYYVELSLDGLLVAAGLHRPASDQLERFRAAIDDGRRAAGFEKAIKTAQVEGLTLSEPELKRAPRGYPQDHPRLDRLRLKQMTVHSRHPLEPWLHKPRCNDLIAKQLDVTRPLVSWLAKHVGPSQRQSV
ncbi:MAG: hypothetical protein QOE38_3068 [Thermoleophilaceae bacterium]|nr:hypothetical protein [Thermoleophilaceae bacterium]